MEKGIEELDHTQLDLFGNDLFSEEQPKKEVIEEATLETNYSKGEQVKYKGEDGLFLHHYSKDGKLSAIRLGNSYIVVLTSILVK